MTWLAQIPHVMWKDARQARWPLVGYAVVVVFAWAQALDLAATSIDGYDASMFLVVLVGMYVAGLFIHADSPTRSDSYWATRPLDPAAVLTSKVALSFIVLIIPPLIAQLHVLIANDVPIRSIASMLGRSVWLYAIWLVVALVIAGMTRDVRSLTLGMFMIPVVFLLLGIVGSFLFDPGESTSATPSMMVATTIIGVAGLILAATTLATLYRTRSLRWHGRVLSLVAILGSIYAMGAKLPGRAPGENVAATFRNAAVVVEVLGRGIRPGASIGVSNVEASNWLVVLQSGDVVFRMKDGSTLRAPVPAETMVLAVPPSPIRGVRWLGRPPFVVDSSRRVISLTKRQEDLFRAGVESAEFDGYVASFEPVIALTLPYREEATYTDRGNSTRVLAANPSRDDSLATLAFSTVDNPDSTSWRPPFGTALQDVRYALVNEARGEALALQRGGSSRSNEALVLPGAWRTTSIENVQLRMNSRDSIPTGWASNAQLVVINWVRRGHSHARIQLQVRQPGNGA
jgi:hypothetical protein